MADYFIGLMSGTSMDGIDAVLMDFSHGNLVHDHSSFPMPDTLKEQLLALCHSGDNEIDRMGQLDVLVAREFAAAANALIESSGIDPDWIRAIGSHGQTIRHRPKLAHPFTLQIGDPNTLAELTGLTVVADFRRRDMAAGGQGAPLVPAFHNDVFRSHDHHRIVLNLGGMANITVLNRDATLPVTGFDTGPANVLMDAWITKHQGQAYDKDGAWAASGTACPTLLEKLLEHPFLSLPAPKSTGREDFHLDWLERCIRQTGLCLAAADVQATLNIFTARTVALEVRKLGLESGELVVCGGGAFNPVLTAALASELPEFRIRSSEEFGISPQWVEAAAFAWLARERLAYRPGNLPEVTGAKGLRPLGGVYIP